MGASMTSLRHIVRHSRPSAPKGPGPGRGSRSTPPVTRDPAHPYRSIPHGYYGKRGAQPGRGEVFQGSLTRASRPAHTSYDDLNTAPLSDDLARAFGPSQDRDPVGVDWSNYGGLDE